MAPKHAKSRRIVKEDLVTAHPVFLIAVVVVVVIIAYLLLVVLGL